MVLGVGAGWLAEESAELNVPFGDRGKRLDGHIAVMRALWSDEKTTLSGNYFDLENCISPPRPACSRCST